MPEKMRNLAVILVSGGMDSSVCAALAMETYRGAFLHIDYNQRTQEKEKECFTTLVQHFNPVHAKILDLSWLGKFGGSALTDSAMPVPENSMHRKTVPTTYVPFRNSVMLSAAVAWAEVLGANAVFYGAVRQDSSGYPDCTSEYVSAFNTLIKLGTSQKNIRLVTPLINMRKKDIITKGISMHVPFEYTWSCYQNSHKACGVCDSCILRSDAFREADCKDPIPYEKPI